MTSRPDALWLAMLVTAGSAMFVAAAVGHGVLRPLLEARGIRPWTVRDSVGALMLVILGSGILGGGLAGVSIGWVVRSAGGMFDVLCLAALAAGALMMRLGLLALRKLT